jgi:hypothetical protein
LRPPVDRRPAVFHADADIIVEPLPNSNSRISYKSFRFVARIFITPSPWNNRANSHVLAAVR